MLAVSAAVAAMSASAHAADIQKANNTTNLADNPSWLLGVAPGATDVALWDNTVTGANTTILGGNPTWQGIRIANPGGNVAINFNSNTLTLGASGIDMSAATANFTNGDAVVLAASQSWTVNAGRTLTQNWNLDLGSNNLTFAGGGTQNINAGATTGFISGAGGLVVNMTGTGIVTLNGTNSYAGATAVNSGILRLNNAAALGGTGASLTVANTGVLTTNTFEATQTILDRFTSTSAGSLAITVASTSNLNFANAGTLSLGSGSGTAVLYSGAITPNGTTYRLGGGGGSLSVSSVLSGGNSLVVGGGGTGGTVTLTGANTYTGPTTISNGTLSVATAANWGAGNVTINNPGTLALGYTLDQATLNRVTSGSSGTVAITGNNSNNLNLTASGTTSLGAVGTANYSGTITPNGTVYRLGGGGGTLNLLSSLSGAGNDLNIGGSGSGGTVVLTGANSYGGATTINSGSTLIAGNGGVTGQLGSGAIVNNGALAFNRSDDFPLSAAVNGTGGLTKYGSNTITLNSTQGYSGATVVNAGRLVLDYTGGATTILSPTANLTLGGGTLSVVGNTSTPTVQSVSSLSMTRGVSTINVTNGATLNLGTLNINVNQAGSFGSAIRFNGPATIDNVGAPVAATGVITTTTAGAGGAAAPFGNLGTNATANLAFGYATVGLYDYASTDINAAGVAAPGTSPYTIVGGSQIPGFYTTVGPTTTSGAANFDMQANFTIGGGGVQRAIGTVRFNTPAATTLTDNATFFTSNSLLVTPAMGANNVLLNGTGGWQVQRGTSPDGTQQGLIWQNNTQGFFTVSVPITNGRDAGDPTTFAKAGAGTLVLSGANSYTGVTNLIEGTTVITNNGNLGASGTGAALNLSGGTLLANASTALDNSSGTGTNARPVTLAGNGGGLAASSTNVLTVSGVVSGAAGSGRLAIGLAASPANGGTAGLLAGTGTGTANAAAVTASGVVTLSGVNTYVGGTTIYSGTLRADNATASTGTGDVVVKNTGVLAGIGTVSGPVSVESGGHVAPGDGAVGNLTLSSTLSLGTGSVLDFEISNPSVHDLITLSSGGLAFATGGVLNLYQPGTTTAFSTTGSYALFNLGTGSYTGNPNTMLTLGNAPAGTTYNFSVASNILSINVMGSLATAWAVDGSGAWDTTTTGNWTSGIPGNPLDTANFPGSIGANANLNRTVTITTDRSVGVMNFGTTGQATPASYTIAGGGGSLKLNNGAAGSAGVNVVSGAHTISAPVVLDSNAVFSVTNDGANASSLNISGNLTGSGGVTVGGTGKLVLSGAANAYAGATAINAGGTLQVGNAGTTGSLGTADVTDNGTLAFNRTNAVTVANNISGITGSVVQSGSGSLLLSGNNTFGTTSGGLIVNAGTAQLGSATALASGAGVTVTGGTLDLNGNAVTISRLTGGAIPTAVGLPITAGGTITDTNATAGATNIALSTTATQDFLGKINDSGTRVLSLTKNNTGRLNVWNPNSTFTGGTTVNAGQVRVMAAGALGTGAVALNVGGGIQFDPTYATGGTFTFANPITINAGVGAAEFLDLPTANTTVTISGAVSMPAASSAQYRLGVSGAGSTVIMTGANTSFGTNTFTVRGNIVFAANGSLTANAGGFIFGRGGGATAMNLTVKDNAVLTAPAGSSMSASGNGATTVTSLTLQDNGSVSVGGGFDVGASSTAAATSTINLNGGSLGATGFSKSSATVTTAINFNGGALKANASEVTPGTWFPDLYNGGVTGVTALVKAGGAKFDTNGFNVTFAQQLDHDTTVPGGIDGGLTKSGAGTLFLTSPAHTYNGATTITGGVLAVTDDQLLGFGTTVKLNGGALGATQSFTTTRVINVTGPNSGLDAAAGQTMTIGSSVTGTGTINKSGAGTLVVPQNLGANISLVGKAGLTSVTVGQTLNGLGAGAGGSVVSESLDLFAKTVAIDGGPASPTGKIDLKSGNLVVTYGTGGSTRPNVEQLVAFGALNANSAGIVTSTGTPGGLTLGVADTADVGGITLYNSGATIPANSVVVRYTYAGDATLDGSVDTADLGVMLDNFGALADPGGRQWSIGDVNYDASVDTADLGLALDNFGQLAGSGAVQAALAGLGFTLADGVETGVANGQAIRFALTGAALPEPASLGLIGVGAMALLGRRRRRA